MKRMMAIAAAGVLSTTSAAHSPRIDNVTIFERGIYRAYTLGASDRSGTMGPLQRVHGIRLIKSTTAVPARRGTRFGLRYLVNGNPRGETVELRMVTRFPESGVFDPHAGRRHYTHEYSMTATTGTAAYRDYHLDDDWEVEPGRWTFEFWLGDRKLAEQEFCLYDPSDPRTAAGCMSLIGWNARSAASFRIGSTSSANTPKAGGAPDHLKSGFARGQ